MNKQEIDKVITDMIDERVTEASETMSKCNILRNAWAELNQQGFTEQAKAFRNLIFTYLLANPKATERDIIYMMVDMINNYDGNRENNETNILS